MKMDYGYTGKTTESDSENVWVGIIVAISNFVILGVGIGVVGGFGFLVRTYSDSLRVLFQDTESGLKQISIAVAVAFSCVAAGRGLYEFRCKKRNLYGFLEIITATLLAVEICVRPTGAWSSTAVLAGLLGAIYVTVRGFDNIAEYKKAIEKAKMVASCDRPEGCRIASEAK